jgi:hypothetical protein
MDLTNMEASKLGVQALVVNSTELFAFLPLKDVVHLLIVLRKLSNPMFVLTKAHERELLAFSRRSKPAYWQHRKLKSVLTATKPVTLDILRTFVNWVEDMPLQLTRTDLLLDDSVTVKGAVCTRTHPPSGMELQLQCAPCTQIMPNGEACGTLVFTLCGICASMRKECAECCGRCSCDPDRQICLECMVDDDKCLACGFRCSGCFDTFKYLDGLCRCEGPPTGGACPHNLGFNCIGCNAGIFSFCTRCQRFTCNDCCEALSISSRPETTTIPINRHG